MLLKIPAKTDQVFDTPKNERTSGVGQGYRMPVMDQGSADVMLRIRHRISAKEGNRGNTLCRFDQGEELAAALICSCKAHRGDNGIGNKRVTKRF